MNIVVTACPESCEVAEFRQCINYRRHWSTVIIARQGKIKPCSYRSIDNKMNPVVDEGYGTWLRGRMERRISTQQDNISLDCRRPHCFVVRQELDIRDITAVWISQNDGIVAGELRRSHIKPLSLCDHGR